MVFSLLHWVPSAIAAILAISLAFKETRMHHRNLARFMILAALVGLVSRLWEGDIHLYSLDLHAFHSWTGLAALLFSLGLFAQKEFFRKRKFGAHCRVGRMTAGLASLSLVTGLLILTGLAPQIAPAPATATSYLGQEPASSELPEIEASEYQGVRLTPLEDQGNNAIEGTQRIDPDRYRLEVTGLVEEELSMSYEELLELPAYSEAVRMPCVEGWGFDAKWTGFRVVDLLALAGLEPEAVYVVFHSADGYSTGVDLDYLRGEEIIMAYGINDVTLPPERGFPFQLVAKDKYGYKWAKWIVGIEVTNDVQRGYWESRGYSDSANVGEFPFEL